MKEDQIVIDDVVGMDQEVMKIVHNGKDRSDLLNNDDLIKDIIIIFTPWEGDFSHFLW